MVTGRPERVSHLAVPGPHSPIPHITSILEAGEGGLVVLASGPVQGPPMPVHLFTSVSGITGMDLLAQVPGQPQVTSDAVTPYVVPQAPVVYKQMGQAKSQSSQATWTPGSSPPTSTPFPLGG